MIVLVLVKLKMRPGDLDFQQLFGRVRPDLLQMLRMLSCMERTLMNLALLFGQIWREGHYTERGSACQIKQLVFPV